MKKLTAGIFSVLMGLVSVNAAEAAVASKNYVDTKIGDTKGKTVVELIDGVSSDSTTLAGRVTTAESEITTLKGDETVAGSVAKKIADAIGGLSAASVGAEGSFISTVSQADGTITAGATPFVAEITDMTKTSTIAPQTAAVAAYVDGKITQIDDSLTDELAPIQQSVADLGAADTALDGRIDLLEADNTTNKTDIAGIKAEQATQNSDIGALKETVAEWAGTGDGSIAKQIETVTQQVTKVETDYKAADVALTTAISEGDAATLAAAKAADAEQTAAITTAYEAADATLKQDLQGYADKAEADAIDTAGANADNKITKLNLAALSRVPAECASDKAYCVLTTNGTNFYWEAIERAAGEEQPAGTAIPKVAE